MNDTITHDIEIIVPDWAWESIAPAIRMLREMIRKAGGTTRVRKLGERVSFSATGPAPHVLAACDAVRKLERHVNDAREELRGFMEKERVRRETDYTLDAINALATGKAPWWIAKGGHA